VSKATPRRVEDRLPGDGRVPTTRLTACSRSWFLLIEFDHHPFSIERSRIVNNCRIVNTC